MKLIKVITSQTIFSQFFNFSINSSVLFMSITIFLNFLCYYYLKNLSIKINSMFLSEKKSTRFIPINLPLHNIVVFGVILLDFF